MGASQKHIRWISLIKTTEQAIAQSQATLDLLTKLKGGGASVDQVIEIAQVHALLAIATALDAIARK